MNMTKREKARRKEEERRKSRETLVFMAQLLFALLSIAISWQSRLGDFATM